MMKTMTFPPMTFPPPVRPSPTQIRRRFHLSAETVVDETSCREAIDGFLARGEDPPPHLIEGLRWYRAFAAMWEEVAA